MLHRMAILSMLYNMNKHVNIPNKDNIGNLPIFKGILKTLFIFGSLYLKIMAAKLTIIKVEKTVKLVIEATILISLRNTKELDKIITINIAT